MYKSIKKDKDYNIQLLRIIGAFLVVVIHVSSYHWYDFSYKSFNWNILNIYDSISRCAVPIFFMISGAFFLDKKKKIDLRKIYSKNILKLVIVYFIFSTIYFIYNVNIRTTNLDYKIIITGPFHFWFIPEIISLYILSPFFKKITENCSNTLLKYFLMLFLLSSILKTISFMKFLPGISYFELLVSKMPINYICNYYSYFLLGYFLYNIKIDKKILKKIYCFGLLSIVLCSIFTFIISIYSNQNTELFYDRFSIFTLIEAISLFLYVKNKEFDFSLRKIEVIDKISSCTLGIYIIHILIMYSLFDFNIIKITSINVILSVSIISVIVFTLSLAIVYGYKRVLKKISIFKDLR